MTAAGLLARRAALTAVVLTVGSAASLAAPAALADQQITAGPAPDRHDHYGATTITAAQGERVTFQNNDNDRHNVFANDSASDGNPLFATPANVDPGQSAVVAGTQYLRAGSYRFQCTIHPGMEATLVITEAGTPVPRPGRGRKPPKKRRPTRTVKRKPCVRGRGRNAKRCAVPRRRTAKRPAASR